MYEPAFAPEHNIAEPKEKGFRNWVLAWENREDFTQQVEEDLQAALNEEGNLPGKLAAQISSFTDILLRAGRNHVGKVRPGRKTRVWLTPPVKAAIRQRNNLRRKIKTHRKEWRTMQSCQSRDQRSQTAEMERGG